MPVTKVWITQEEAEHFDRSASWEWDKQFSVIRSAQENGLGFVVAHVVRWELAALPCESCELLPRMLLLNDQEICQACYDNQTGGAG
jgi:hypothetical protein